jgi:hypothetical protein
MHRDAGTVRLLRGSNTVVNYRERRTTLRAVDWIARMCAYMGVNCDGEFGG